MGKKAFSERKDKWQVEGGKKAITAEQNFYNVFDTAFINTNYKLHKNPKELKNLYSHVKLAENILNEIYNPKIDLSAKNWGISPDFAIENTITKKILFGEIKRQDGWVEGKLPSAGRGNAHERLCKLFTPGLLKVYRKVSKINNKSILPF